MDGGFGLLAHAVGDGAAGGVFEGCGVDERNGVAAKLGLPSRRSRVEAGRSETSASRVPVSRLKRVDLPTLGRPTMAILGSMFGVQGDGGTAPAAIFGAAYAGNVRQGKVRGSRRGAWLNWGAARDGSEPGSPCHAS